MKSVTLGNRGGNSVGFSPAPERFRVHTERDIERIKALEALDPEHRFQMRVVASVLPFRVNEYVIRELIDWDQAPQDPLFQLTFPQRGMLTDEMYERMATLHRQEADPCAIRELARELRAELNPHPAGQLRLNVPRDEAGNPISGLQHKYRQTVLFFPSQGQTCHSYCTFCFRWAQFVGDKSLRMASTEAGELQTYLRSHPEVTDLLMTGGDPMVMKTKILAGYLEPLLHPDFDHVQSIRIGTKSLSFWPQRFVMDEDADELLRMIERLVKAGKHLSVMAHYNHWRELEPAIAREAIRRVRDTGAQIRSQGPLLQHINDHGDTWARLWNTQVKLGIIPYYMFMERDTGARHYFEVPIIRAWEIYRDAIQQVSGLARTVRGPSMSAGPGKIEVQGLTQVKGEKVFVLRFLQGRDADWVHRPFFARYDEQATWLNELKPAFSEEQFFFESGYKALLQQNMTDEEVCG